MPNECEVLKWLKGQCFEEALTMVSVLELDGTARNMQVCGRLADVQVRGMGEALMYGKRRTTYRVVLPNLAGRSGTGWDVLGRVGTKAIRQSHRAMEP